MDLTETQNRPRPWFVFLVAPWLLHFSARLSAELAVGGIGPLLAVGMVVGLSMLSTLPRRLPPSKWWRFLTIPSGLMIAAISAVSPLFGSLFWWGQYPQFFAWAFGILGVSYGFAYVVSPALFRKR